MKRLWARDASLWTNEDEANWLGWLTIADDDVAHSRDFKQIADEIRQAGFTHAVLLGMGGSSLCVEVMELTYGKIDGYPQFLVLDSTDPAQIRTLAKKLDMTKTIFIVSSKSGSTLEPNIFKQYFYEQVKQAVTSEPAGKRFIAITDPGSHLQKVAEADGFRHVFFGVPSIGGRYSALSDFGMVPGAIQGIDLPKFLDRVEEMVHACASVVPADENPGAILGAILGTLQKNGRDKVTIFASPGISDLGAWLEQLLAESTGKKGTGLIPIDREQIGPPEVYGNDRIFAYLRLQSAPDAKQDEAVAALEKAGQPVVRIAVPDVYDLGQEFFRWEIATAVAGSVIGINPFNQPDVEAAKIATKNLTSEYEKQGSLPAEHPFFEGGGIKLYSDDKNTEALKKAAGGDLTLTGYLRAHLNRVPTRRLFRDSRLHRNERCASIGIAVDPSYHSRQEARGHLLGIRPAFPAFDRAGLQRRTQHRRISANHLRRRRRYPGARAEIYIRNRQSCAGSRRLPGSRGAGSPGIANSSGSRTLRQACGPLTAQCGRLFCNR